jgi:V8-like Glu-specific endopeptidase
MRWNTRIAAVLAASALAAAAHAQTSELRFPGDQFDRAAYRPTQATGNPRYEAVLMDMREANFEALANYDAGDDVRRMAEPVGLLKVMLRGEQYITCTASVIDAGLILTNWHCLPKYGADATKAAIWMGFYSDDERGTERYAVDVRPVESDRALDYAILRVTGDLSKWGRVKLATVDPPANRSLSIVHHPAGRPKQLTQKNCRTADPALAKGELRHKCDTLEGSSGAPVFFGTGDAARMVALHFAGVPQSVRGVDPSFEANLAIPLSRIAEKSTVVRRLVGAAKAPAACRSASHGIEGYAIDEVLTGAPGQSEWSSRSPGGRNSKTQHCDSRARAIQATYPDAVLGERFGEFDEQDGQYKYRCRIRVQREPIYVLRQSSACPR